MVPQAILLESFLSFLGIGIQEPQVTWGLMAADSVKTINTVQNHWWLLVPPCAALAITLLALNFLGDGLRDAFDPQTKR
jgi:ABC-type dipeptide/oligopeptide/nickel transport system permease subunit